MVEPESRVAGRLPVRFEDGGKDDAAQVTEGAEAALHLVGALPKRVVDVADENAHLRVPGVGHEPTAELVRKEVFPSSMTRTHDEVQPMACPTVLQIGE